MEGRAIRPRLSRSSGRGAPKNKHVVFGRVGAREGISNDDFGCIWINCTETSKGDIGGRIDDGREDKVCGEKNQEGVDGTGYDGREASGGKGEQQFPDDVLVAIGVGLWTGRSGQRVEQRMGRVAHLVLSSRRGRVVFLFRL